MTPDDLAMHLEIAQVLARCANAVDYVDLDMALDAYWPDAVDHHGPAWDGNAHDYMRDLIGRFAGYIRDGRVERGPMHHLGLPLIVRTGPADALAECYFTAYAQRPDVSGVDVVVGRYLDRFQRRDGRRKVLQRTVTMEFVRPGIDLSVNTTAHDRAPGFPGAGFDRTIPASR